MEHTPHHQMAVCGNPDIPPAGSLPPSLCDVTSATDLMNTKDKCVICNEVASGIFFGALVCLPCKSFFIRCTRDGKPSFLCQFDGNCDISYHNRSNCQSCRYIKCIQAGMHRKERPESIEPIHGQELCRVCGDVSNGVHFGIHTCEGCKKFFRRGLKESQTYICKGKMDCSITPRSRNMCRYCRFNKCRRVGMSREAVRMGRPRKDRSGPTQMSADQSIVAVESLTELHLLVKENGKHVLPSVGETSNKSEDLSFPSHPRLSLDDSLNHKNEMITSDRISPRLNDTGLFPEHLPVCNNTNQPNKMENSLAHGRYLQPQLPVDAPRMPQNTSRKPETQRTHAYLCSPKLDHTAISHLNTRYATFLSFFPDIEHSSQHEFERFHSKCCCLVVSDCDGTKLAGEFAKRWLYWTNYRSLAVDDQLCRADLSLIELLVEQLEPISQRMTDNAPNTNNCSLIPPASEDDMCRAPDYWSFVRWIAMGSVAANVDFALHIPGFRELQQIDQVCICKRSTFMVIILVASVLLFDLDTRRFRTTWALGLPPDQLLHQFTSNLKGLAQELRSLQVDRRELALLSAIIIMAGDEPGLKNPGMIEKARQPLLRLLSLYDKKRNGTKSSRMRTLLQMVPKISLFSQWLLEIFNQLQFVNVDGHMYSLVTEAMHVT